MHLHRLTCSDNNNNAASNSNGNISSSNAHDNNDIFVDDSNDDHGYDYNDDHDDRTMTNIYIVLTSIEKYAAVGQHFCNKHSKDQPEPFRFTFLPSHSQIQSDFTIVPSH